MSNPPPLQTDDVQCKDIARQYFEAIYNSAFRDLMQSVTEEEYELVKQPEMFDLDMNYEDYIKSIERGAPEHEIEDTVEKIEQFLQQYVAFREEIYGHLLTGMGKFLSDHSDDVKKNIAEGMVALNQSRNSESESNEDELEEPEPDTKRMRTGTADLNTPVDHQTQTKIACDNEERGVLKVSVAGRDIEVETHGNIILNQLYSILFTLFCMLNEMEMRHVPSDRPKIYKSPLEDQSSEFSLLLDKI